MFPVDEIVIDANVNAISGQPLLLPDGDDPDHIIDPSLSLIERIPEEGNILIVIVTVVVVWNHHTSTRFRVVVVGSRTRVFLNPVGTVDALGSAGTPTALVLKARFTIVIKLRASIAVETVALLTIRRRGGGRR